jgi:hypothetical protein
MSGTTLFRALAAMSISFWALAATSGLQPAATPQTDRYTVPQGGVPELLKFIEDLSQYRPDSPRADSEHRSKFRPALQQAAEKIIRLEKDPKSDGCQVARFILLANRVRWFARAVPSEQRQVIADVKAYLAEQLKQGQAREAAELARSAAEALQCTSQWDQAAEAYESFAGLLQQNGGAGLSAIAASMQSSARRLKAMSQQLPPARQPEIAPKGRMIPLDLKGKFNWRSVDVSDGVWHGNGLAELPKGEQTLAGVKFKLSDEQIQLGCRSLPSAPAKVEKIPVNRRVARLYVLHALQYGTSDTVADGTHLADYTMHYADGSEAAMPVVFGEDMRNWWDFDYGKPVTRGRVVWTGTNHASEKLNRTLRFYLGVWENPHPGKPVSHLDFVCAKDGPCAPFCMAITVEEPAETR